MRFNILIGGKAGQGINELATILARTLGKIGFYVFNYRDYGSLITGGHNFNVVCVSDKKTGSYDENIDLVLALDNNTLDIHKKKFNDKTIFVLNFETNQKNSVYLMADKDKTENMAFATAVFKILGLDKKFLIDEVKARFAGKSLLAKDLQVIDYFYAKEFGFNIKLNHENSSKIVLNGAEAVSQGTIASDINVYLAYPMTPSTTLLNYLAKSQDEKFFVFSPEDEIAVANAGLGASFAGARTMIGTSGGGFDLMTEAMSMQSMTEIPLVVYLAQRAGPSTGVPTYTSQQDMLVSLFGGHGEGSRVVIAPGNAKECIEKTNEAFYLAEKFGVLSIILSDKHIAESDFSFHDFKFKPLSIPKRKSMPGIAGEKFRRSSYEHDKEGNNTENIDDINESFKKRAEKDKALEKETKKFETYKVYGKGKNLIIGFGSTKGAILDSLDELDARFLQILYLSPFPKEITSFIKSSKNVFILESNATGQLAKLIAMNTGFVVDEKNKILKCDGRPFIPEQIIKEIGKRGGK
jgi:2-oxoglutarate ferredoxin oxidoreductase subunit alpha